MPHCSEVGDCHQSHTIAGRYKFEDKTYSIEESVMLRRDSFARTQILRHQNLEGELTTGADPQQGSRYVTFHEDVPVGRLKPVYRDEIVSVGWYSKANGYPDKMCGFVGGSTTRDIQVKVNLCTTALHQEEDLCMKQFLASWQQTSLARGAMNKGRNIFISDDVFYAFEKQNVVGIDRHFWHGDYKSSDKSVMHFDGVIKKAVLAMGNEAGQIYTFDFSGIVSGLCIEGIVGAKSFNVPFNTDQATTLDDFVSALDAMTRGNTGEKVFASVSRATTIVTVEAHPGETVIGNLQFLVTNCDGIEQCPDGTIKGNSDVAESVTVTATETQAVVKGNKPIGINWEAISAANVLTKFEQLHEAILAAKPEMLVPSWGGNLFVAPNVFSSLQIKLIKERAAFIGSNRQMEEMFDVYGFPRVIKANYLQNNEMIFFRPQDVHVSTDLRSDVMQIEQGYDRKCDEAWFKNEFAMGVEISEPANVAGTFCNRRDTFQAAMPCTATDIDHTHGVATSPFGG